MMKEVRRILLVLTAATAAEAAASVCSTSITAREFQCPNTNECPASGYSYVKDCLDCVENMNTDSRTKQCFQRKLFTNNNNNGNTDNNTTGTNYLWRDLLGLLVWFGAAGVATACGVGGGGIYVPLGILILGFAPKPSSGLSQSSIFGASLGGLLLNINNIHPFTSKVEDNTVTSDIPSTDATDGVTTTTEYYTRPLIDYNMALFLAPMEMAGAVLGVLIQKILPNWLYLFVAAIILGYTSKKTYVKWWSTRQQEEEALVVVVAAAAGRNQTTNQHSTHNHNNNNTTDVDEEHVSVTSDPEQHELHEGTEAAGTEAATEATALVAETITSIGTRRRRKSSDGEIEVTKTMMTTTPLSNLSGGNDGDDNNNNNTTSSIDNSNHYREMDTNNIITLDDDKIAKRKWYLERDARQYPPEKLLSLGVLWIGLTLLTFLKGGKGVESIVGIDCASPWYGALIGIQFMWTFGFAALFAYKLTTETTDKLSVQYPFHSQDVVWDYHKTLFYAFFTFVAGIVAGLIGIGGGMVLGPLMLVMGIYPRVSTATTATMIVLTSSSVAVLYITSGLVPWQYAITFFCTCFVGALVGKTYIDGYVKRTGKSSVLIFLLATIIALATIGALVIALMRLSANAWCFDGFNQFCSLNHDDGTTASVSCVPNEDNGQRERYLLSSSSSFHTVVVPYV